MVAMPRTAAGFAYIGLLFAVAILGITLSAVGVVWSTQIRREKEEQLMFVGDQFRIAIGRYLASGGGYPESLNDLVEDKRTPVARHYLRRIYPDPMTNGVDWDLIKAPEGGIIGVASTSKDKPLKVANFPIEDPGFDKAESYNNWQFIYSPRIHRRRAARPAGQP
jgi:type II secretory pathway pseudopilin PulG